MVKSMRRWLLVKLYVLYFCLAGYLHQGALTAQILCWLRIRLKTKKWLHGTHSPQNVMIIEHSQPLIFAILWRGNLIKLYFLDNNVNIWWITSMGCLGMGMSVRLLHVDSLPVRWEIASNCGAEMTLRRRSYHNDLSDRISSWSCKTQKIYFQILKARPGLQSMLPARFNLPVIHWPYCNQNMSRAYFVARIMSGVWIYRNRLIRHTA